MIVTRFSFVFAPIYMTSSENPDGTNSMDLPREKTYINETSKLFFEIYLGFRFDTRCMGRRYFTYMYISF